MFVRSADHWTLRPKWLGIKTVTFHPESSKAKKKKSNNNYYYYYGFESNVNNNAVRKKEKYLNLINEMSRNYRSVRFVNLSMSSLGVFSDECSTFLEMMNDIGIDKKQQRYIIKKMINIAIRATFYIFCCRNRNWDSLDLIYFFFLAFFCFVFVFVVFCFFCFSCF